MQASVVIRARNEEKWLPSVLKMLESQTTKDFEVILVDNESTDGTLKIFQDWAHPNKKIVYIPKDDFTYPYAANSGVKKAQAPIIIFLSAHSVPISNNYIAGAIRELSSKRVAGAFGDSYPLSDASKFEKFYYGKTGATGEKRVASKVRMGVLGMTSAAIKKELWEEYPFNETVCAKGGEDTEWAIHFMKRGYKVIFTPDMLVYHSHGYRLPRFIKQYIHWTEVYLRARLNNLG